MEPTQKPTLMSRVKQYFTLNNFIVFLHKSNHWWLAVILLLLTPIENYFLRLIDPTAAPLDSGVYSVVYTAMIANAVLLGFATIGQRINHRPGFDVGDDDVAVQNLLNEVTPSTKLWYGLLTFALYLFSGVICLLAVASIAG